MKAEEIKLYLSKRDVILKEIINTIPFPTVCSTQNVFHDLMSCIIEQQIHYRSTKKTFAKLLDKASIEMLTPDNFEEFEDQALQHIKLSQGKYETIVALLEFFQEPIPEWQTLEDMEVYQTLRSIKGIGQWSVDMILMYTLERHNVFPVQDFHLKNVMTSLYSLDKQGLSSALKAIALRWSPYQSFGVKYLLAWKEVQKLNKP